MHGIRTPLALLAVVAATGLAAVPAHAAPAATGRACTFGGANDATAEAGTVTGSLAGGPLALTDGTTPESATLTCYIVVGTSAGPAVSSHGTGVVSVGPGTVSFTSDGDFAVCSALTWDGDGVTEYFDSTSGVWTPDPSAACDVPASPPPVYGSVVGGISIARAATGAPVVAYSGYLTSPSLFTCQAGAFDPQQPFVVTCTPQPSAPVTFYCAVLHANATALTAGASVRMAMDCDGDGTPEAITRTATGPDMAYVWAVSNVAVSAFTCTASDGSGHALAIGTDAFCGDPGAARVGR
jgi:hypothetical protein